MTNLNKIIKTVRTAGAITLQGIYEEHPDIKKEVIRATINRYVKNNKNKVFDRFIRGVYISLVKKNENKIISLNSNKAEKKKALLKHLNTKSKRIKVKNKLKVENTAKVVGLNDFEDISTHNTSLIPSEEDSIGTYDIHDESFSPYRFFNENYDNQEEETKQKDISYFLNKVFNEDAIDFLKKIPDKCIDLVFTDPPYKTTPRGRGKNTTTGGMMKTKLTEQGRIFEHNDIEPYEYMPELFRVLKDGTHCYVMTNHKNLILMLESAIKSGFKFVKSLVWDKVSKMFNNYYMDTFEYILLLRKGPARPINFHGTPDILTVPANKARIGRKAIHPTEKPVGLAEIIIENSSNENEVVLDPFAGTGSVGKGCKVKNRKYILNEINEFFYNYAVETIASY